MVQFDVRFRGCSLWEKVCYCKDKKEVKVWLKRCMDEGLVTGFVGFGWCWDVVDGWKEFDCWELM